MLRINEDLDAARGPWLPSDETGAFQREHHLVNRRRADAKVFLHVGFGRGSAVQARIEVDKGQVLPLLAADAGGSDEEIARSVVVGGSTVYRTKRRFVEGSLERALSDEPRPGAERELTGKEDGPRRGRIGDMVGSMLNEVICN